jgi:hypothetical protein
MAYNGLRMAERGKTKPSKASRQYRIHGTRLAPEFNEGVSLEVLSNPRRRRNASQQEAHRAQLRDEIKDSLAKRIGPMKQIKDA